ncbi:hypothetical protein Krad_4518 (plasmid) [Kineococcus radiotolerans SRS30216 = ATCC BAA-149]|uniref:Uncharacterized protein n=1 Tax=Kineococcus radiotolerans (strain ATCC BAA-149 / DSM 14245 / SRS30216) TaxID=266940 RepID=A6WGN8_KINRD|nr:hypothetical protein Krad_4518 [Kineococcus radiotolerans SRS30216 = ATCC BAA-149]
MAHDGLVGRTPETNIRLPAGAVTALNSLAAHRDQGQAATLRELLSDYVDRQQAVPAQDRRAHISTVLRYPSRSHRHPSSLDDDVTTRQIRIRADADLVERARSLALRLPGQPERRGQRDYQARTLTDAVMTAIAFHATIKDDFLHGLLPLVRHGAAHGLWRLTIAATLTRAEKEAQADAETDDLAAQVAWHLENMDVAWHHYSRVRATRNLARVLLHGPNACANEQDLYAQVAGGWWERALADLADSSKHDEHELLELFPSESDEWGTAGMEGRGGTAVWRARRLSTLATVAGWLSDLEAPLLLMQPPGWTLAAPPNWRAMVTAPSRAIPHPWVSLVEERRVLALRRGSQWVIWPLTPAGKPVEGVQSALHGLQTGEVSRRHSDEELAEALLVHAGEDFIAPLYVPVLRAQAAGFLTPEEATRIQLEARNATQARMRAVLTSGHPQLTPAVAKQLRGLQNSPYAFADVCARNRIPFTIESTARLCPPVSLAQLIDNGASPETLQWMGTTMLRARLRGLRHSQHAAWLEALTKPGEATRNRRNTQRLRRSLELDGDPDLIIKQDPDQTADETPILP